MEGLITENLIIGVGLMVFGLGLLNWCERMERKEFKTRHDPRKKWAYIDGTNVGEEKKRTIVGTLMALTGGGMALFGFVMIVIHFSTWDR